MSSLNPFTPELAPDILKWPLSFFENYQWCGQKQFPLEDNAFEAWHLDPDLKARVLYQDTNALAYGEIAENAFKAEAEIQRVIVSPEHRQKGHGSALIKALVRELSPEIKIVYARVFPNHQSAMDCFQRAGFKALDEEKRTQFNEWESVDYLWFEYLI